MLSIYTHVDSSSDYHRLFLTHGRSGRPPRYCYFQFISCLHLTFHFCLKFCQYWISLQIKVSPYLHQQVFKFYYLFKQFFSSSMSSIKFECQSLKWARFDCYLHQSSCFGLRQSLLGLAIKLTLVFMYLTLLTLQLWLSTGNLFKPLGKAFVILIG